MEILLNNLIADKWYLFFLFVMVIGYVMRVAGKETEQKISELEGRIEKLENKK